MFGLFTKNLDTMERATKKNTKSVGELDIPRIDKKELREYLGGNQSESEKKKKRSFFLDLFGPGPCEGHLPQ
jgi:hypothetical protein